MSMSNTEIKKVIAQAIDRASDELSALSSGIHKEPELAFKEFKAAELLVGFLRGHGFEVRTGTAGLPTAFVAERRFGEGQNGGPRIAFLAEYDALPEIGHACGHNLIAMMSVGAGLGLCAALEGSKEISGTVLVIGTPGEEGLGGKINLAEDGVFGDIDCCLMIHPSGENLINRGSTALQHWHIAFEGRTAHSSAPEDGVNALTAVIETFNNIDKLRPLMPMSANVNGIITHGGTAANVITGHASCEFTVRAENLKALMKVNSYIDRAVKAAGVLTGADATIKQDPAYAEMHPNRAINYAFKENMETMGITMNDPAQGGKYGSSDIGNVSVIVPSMHAYLDIGCEAPGHTAEFARASISNEAFDLCVKGAKGLAMTGLDVLTDSGLLDKIKREFQSEFS